MTPKSAITYARQSKQREDESQGSPEAQREKCAALIAARGWTHGGHFEDLGASGYDPKTPRPGLDAALAAVARGEASALVIYRLDRLTRRGVAEALRIVATLRDHGAALVSVNEPFLDTTTAIGTGIFGLFAAMAEQESENISNRSKASKATLRAAGSHAGGRPPFGFNSERSLQGKLVVNQLVPNPAEAGILREVVARVLVGATVVSLARELNARGLRPRSGAEWRTSTLTRQLRAPQVAGFMPAYRTGRNAEVPRDSRGRILLELDAAGQPLQPWEPIVPPADWYRLQDILDSRPAVRGKSRGPSLLSGGGFLRCSVCGGGMAAAVREVSSAYRCMKHRTGGTCKGTSVSLPRADEHVSVAVFNRLATLDPSNAKDAALLSVVTERFAARNADPEVLAERTLRTVARDTARLALERLDDDRAAGMFPGETGASRYARQVRNLTAQFETAQAALAALPGDSAPAIPWLDLAAYGDTGPIGPDSPWASWTVLERREFLKLAIDYIDVLPNATGHGGGNKEFRGGLRLKIHWAGEGT
jgi:site-specific DNA recombinase